jgi:hypothetical protein
LDRQSDESQLPLLEMAGLFGIGKCRGMNWEKRETVKDLTGFFIASLFVCNLLLVMEPQPHTFHPPKQPENC